jgi:Trk K+ transport system NAD-binding subunit
MKINVEKVNGAMRENGKMSGKSRERIRKFVAFLTGAYFIWMAYMLLTPRPEVPRLGFALDFLHLGAFGVLGLGVGLARRNWSTGRWRVLLLLWAVGSECLQILTGRCFELGDIFQNVVGVLLGLEAGRLLRLWTRKKNADETTENDKKRAEELATILPKVTVIEGNGTQHDLLIEEGIEAMDAFVALTNIDEENMIVSMFANKMKVKKTITQIKNEDLYGMLSELDINNTVSPKDIVANRVISYIRALDNSVGSNVLTLYRLVNNQVEALEFLAKRQEKIYDTPLRELKIKDNCLIACIIRGTTVIIPDGNATIQLGDNVIAVTTHKNFDDLADILE